MNLFEKLEATPISDWLVDSLYAYPAMLAGHGIGMSIVIGILFILNLRLLGCFSGIEVTAFKTLIKLDWAGFLLNFFTGCILFVQKATSFIEIWPFLVKIAGVFMATILAVFIQKMIRERGEAWDAGETIETSARTLAVISLLTWSVVIITGRLVGYLLQ